MELTAILSAFGLAGAAGLNAYIPLLSVGVLARLGILRLAPPFDALGSLPVIIVLVVLLLVELVVDKVPGADHLNDVIQTVIRPAAGAVLFAANAGVVDGLPPAVLIGLGLVVAFGVHATKAVARPVVNATTLGFGTPAVSITEDAISLSTSLVAVFAPLVVAGIALVFGLIAYWVWSRRRRARRAARTKRRVAPPR
jgi:hypothetical protein